MAAMNIRAMEKLFLQSSVIYGYSHFSRRQIKDIMMDSKEGNVGCVIQF